MHQRSILGTQVRLLQKHTQVLAQPALGNGEVLGVQGSTSAYIPQRVMGLELPRYVTDDCPWHHQLVWIEVMADRVAEPMRALR
jgi:hypothetical protein